MQAEAPIVRAATVDDLPELRDVYRWASLSNEDDRANLLAHPELLELDPTGVHEGRTIATVHRGRVVGFATYEREAEHVELDALFVHPDHRRAGHARRLVEAVVDEARRAGVLRIEVTANEHAAAFYEAAGFVPVGTVETRFGPAPRRVMVLPSAQEEGSSPTVP